MPCNIFARGHKLSRNKAVNGGTEERKEGWIRELVAIVISRETGFIKNYVPTYYYIPSVDENLIVGIRVGIQADNFALFGRSLRLWIFFLGLRFGLGLGWTRISCLGDSSKVFPII